MLSTIDLLLLGGFILYALSSGWRARKEASRNLEEYFLAGRTLRGWQAGLSMAATQFAADTPLLVTGLIATAGIFSLWQLWSYAVAFLLLGFVLAPSWRHAGVITDAELTEIRYSGKPAAGLRLLKAIYFGTIFNCTVLAMVLLATTRIAEPFLHWHQWLPSWLFQPLLSMVKWVNVPLTVNLQDPMVWHLSTNNLISIVVIVAVTMLYSSTGGLRSVVATDTVQLAIMLIGSLLYAIYIVVHVGGFDAMFTRLQQLFAQDKLSHITLSQLLAFTPTQAKDAGLAVLTLFGVQWLVQMNADGTGYLAQRTMACRSDRDARQAAVIFTFVQVLLRSLIWLPIGLGLLVLFAPEPGGNMALFKAQREATFVTGMAKLLPPGVLGLLLTAMLAALASTVDTHLNWGSSYWTNDIYRRFIAPVILKKEPSPRSLVWIARFANLLILVLAFIIMTQLSSIQRAWKISLLLGAGMGVMLLMRWLWWRVTAWGEVATILASAIMAPLLLAWFPNGEAVRLLIMAAVATGAGVAASYLLPPTNHEQLVAFYQLVRPPGFWGPIARQAGLPPDGVARLGRSCLATLAAAFTIFCWLIGLGSWMAGSPPPTWFPFRTAWIISLLLIGLALCPVWWKWGFSEDAYRTPKQ